jgi:hypothetical protein
MRTVIKFIRRRVPALLLPVVSLCAGGCTSFNHDWDERREPTPPTALEGRWQGVWVSEQTHHTDNLRCVVTKHDNGTYAARFLAKYRKVLSFGYTVPLNVQTTTSGFTFSGEANLGWLAGGVYHYEGRADATNFFSTYTSKYDHGTFQMTRP